MLHYFPIQLYPIGFYAVMDYWMYSLLFTALVVWTFLHLRRKSAKLPPGPYQLPVIGNLHLLGQKPHQSLTKLSKIYGPVMSIKLGSLNAIFVTSPEIAKEVLQTHDQYFCSRITPIAAQALDHDQVSMIWLPVSEKWRKLRKICKENMFSAPRLDGSGELRREKLQQLLDYMQECCLNSRVVDIGEAAFITSLNLMSATLFSTDISGYQSDSSNELRKIVDGTSKAVVAPNLADYFPLLKYFDVQGIKRKAEVYVEKELAVFDDVIDHRLKSRGEFHDSGVMRKDLLEALLESELSRHEIKHLIMDLFGAGTDTTSVTLEWAMTELLRNPEIISKAKTELMNVIGKNKQVEESDIARLPYLQAIIKETLRVHPPAPFLVPRRAEVDIEINGYLFPKHWPIFVNEWAISRDPNIWSDADSFQPERFLESKIDLKGQYFELFPFGAGRRICPGLPLAYRMLHLLVAYLVHNFDWELEGGIKPEELDMNDKFGLALQKAVPLKAVPLKISNDA